MLMLSLIVQAIGAVIGGFLAAAIVCWLFWTGFKLLRHPEWGPLVVLVGGLAILHDSIGASPFLQVAALFSALFAGGCWWRYRRDVGRCK